MDRGLVERARDGDREGVRAPRPPRGPSPVPGGAPDPARPGRRRGCRPAARWSDIWRDLPRLRDLDRFDAWTYRLVVRASLDEARQRRRHAHVRELPPDGPSAPDGSGSLATRDALERAFDRLRPEQRAVVVLHHYAGFPLTDIAVILGVPYGTVGSRLHHDHELRGVAAAGPTPTPGPARPDRGPRRPHPARPGARRRRAAIRGQPGAGRSGPERTHRVRLGRRHLGRGPGRLRPPPVDRRSRHAGRTGLVARWPEDRLLGPRHRGGRAHGRDGYLPGAGRRRRRPQRPRCDRWRGIPTGDGCARRRHPMVIRLAIGLPSPSPRQPGGSDRAHSQRRRSWSRPRTGAVPRSWSST